MKNPSMLSLRTAGFALMAVCLAGVCALGLSSCGNKASQSQEQKLQVVASFYPMADFASKIGGDKVEVVSLVPDGTEPHDWEPSPKDITKIESAKVFVYNGADMEHWVDDALKALKNKDLTVVNASEGVALIEADEHDHDHGHEAEGKDAHHHDAKEEHHTDPHTWLNPLNAKIEMKNIMDALIKVDPDNKAYYEANYQTYAKKCDELNAQYQEKLEAVKHHTIVVAHNAFNYMTQAYGLKSIAIEGINADGEPSPAQMAKIVEAVKEAGITTIFAEELVSPKTAEAVAKAANAKVATLNPLEGLSDEERKANADYFSVMQQNLDALVAALG